jgi:hypothetical protein
MYSIIWSVFRKGRATRGRTDADDARWLLWRVVEDALPDIVVQVRAVMVCFHGITFGVVSICMESIEVGAYSFDRREVLSRVSIFGEARAEPKTSPAQHQHQSRESCSSRFPAHQRSYY